MKIGYWVTVSSVRAGRHINRLPHRGHCAVTVDEDGNDSSKRKVHGCPLPDPLRVKWDVISRRCGIELGGAFQINVVGIRIWRRIILTVGLDLEVNNDVSSVAGGVVVNLDSRRSRHGDREVVDAGECRDVECAVEIRGGVRSQRAGEKENQPYRQNRQATLCAFHSPPSRRGLPST
jgi:hypothetical protein